MVDAHEVLFEGGLAICSLLLFKCRQVCSTPIRYYLALLAVLIVTAVLLLIFPSLRKYRRRRNILIYIAIVVVLFSLVAQIDNVSRRAIVDFSVGGSANFYGGETNQLAVFAGNHGNRAVSFKLIISSVNVSFQIQPQQDCIQINNRTCKVPFSLQESSLLGSSENKPLFFTIDENVSGFSFSVSLEAQPSGSVSVASGITYITYTWNGIANCYVPGPF